MKERFTTRTLQARRHGAGMTLVEVLVTLVIISVGLLGVAALQLTTVRNNYDAYIRSQAAVLASDILDRMRANREAAAQEAYTVAIDPAATPGSGNANAMSRSDIQAWKSTLAAQLPNGRGSIATEPIEGQLPRRAIVIINVQWGERGADDPLVFTTSTQI